MSDSFTGATMDDPYSSQHDEVQNGSSGHAFFGQDGIIGLSDSDSAHLFSSKSFKRIGRCSHGNQFNQTLVSLVPQSSIGVVGFANNSFQIWDFSGNRPISPLKCVEEDICAIRAISRRIVILTKTKLLIFILKSLELIFCMNREADIPDDSAKVLSVSPGGLVAFLTSPGTVQVVDSITLFRNPPVSAHSSQITALDLTDDVLITGSRKGTIIRLFSIPSMSLRTAFRRGRSESTIRSINASSIGPGLFIAVTGDSETVHIFHIPSPSSDLSAPSVSMMGSVLKLLPFQYRDAVEPERAYCFIRLRREGDSRYVARVLESGKAVVVCESTGFAFVHDASKPGECRLLSEHALLSNIEKEPAEVIPKRIAQPAPMVVNSISKSSGNESGTSPKESSSSGESSVKLSVSSEQSVSSGSVSREQARRVESVSHSEGEFEEAVATKMKKKKKKRDSEIISEAG
jgi:WD40 repeat protein